VRSARWPRPSGGERRRLGVREAPLVVVEEARCQDHGPEGHQPGSEAEAFGYGVELGEGDDEEHQPVAEANGGSGVGPRGCCV